MRRTFTATATIIAIFAFSLSPSPANAVTRQTLNLLGVAIHAKNPVGSVDPNTDATIDGGLTWHPAIVSRLHPWPTAYGTNAWLNCEPNGPYDTLGASIQLTGVGNITYFAQWSKTLDPTLADESGITSKGTNPYPYVTLGNLLLLMAIAIVLQVVKARCFWAKE